MGRNKAKRIQRYELALARIANGVRDPEDVAKDALRGPCLCIEIIGRMCERCKLMTAPVEAMRRRNVDGVRGSKLGS